MRPLKERVEDLQKKAALQEYRAGLPNCLTTRVVGGAPDGKTDSEIGEERFITVNNVDNHARNIPNETGAANRTEAEKYAALHGLTADLGDPGGAD